MKQRNRVIIILIIITCIIVGYFYFFGLKQAEYKFIAKVAYTISNDSLFDQTGLATHSYGFLIGTVPIQGIAINMGTLDQTKEYVFSKDRPIKAIYTNSRMVRNEGLDYLPKKPLDIIPDRTVFDPMYLYVYELENSEKYRLLLP